MLNLSKLGPLVHVELMRAANEAVRNIVARLPAEHADKGGYFRAFTVDDPNLGMTGLVPVCEGWVGGAANGDKCSKYFVISFEKALRLMQHAGAGARSSWNAARNPANDQYGGAILFRVKLYNSGDAAFWVVLSFSGLPELADEAAMIVTAASMPWQASINSLNEIARTSDNQIITLA